MHASEVETGLLLLFMDMMRRCAVHNFNFSNQGFEIFCWRIESRDRLQTQNATADKRAGTRQTRGLFSHTQPRLGP